MRSPLLAPTGGYPALRLLDAVITAPLDASARFARPTTGAVGGIAAASAAAASTIPAPHSAAVQSAPVPVWKVRALDVSAVSTCAGVMLGLRDSISDTTPTTCGVAMLVPEYDA